MNLFIIGKPLRRFSNSLVANKNKTQDLLKEFIANVKSDELKIEFNERLFVVRPVEDTSVLDLLSSHAEDLGPEDLSINIDHYLYGLIRKGNLVS